jgi:hypothetical protein
MPCDRGWLKTEEAVVASEFLLGCTCNHLELRGDVTPLRRFEAVRDAGVFDYIDWLPQTELLGACIDASERTGIPMTTGYIIHQLGDDDPSLSVALHNAARAGNKVVNVMLKRDAVDGHDLSDSDVVDLYQRMTEVGDKVGVMVSFEVHTDCWSERLNHVTPVIELAKRRGVHFHLTMDYSHVLWRVENPEQLAVSGITEDVAAGRLRLDPYEPENILTEWLDFDVVDYVQFRPVIPNNPRNVWGRYPDGSMPRGIMYPFAKPAPGEWHSPWYAYKLDACKEAMRTVLRHHLTRATSPLKFVTTEMIWLADYGMGAKFSLIDQNAACARWIRDSWSQLKAMHEADIPLKI